LLLIAFWVYRTRVPAIESEAQSVGQEILFQRGSLGYRFALREEKAHLSEEQWKAVYKELILPTLSDITWEFDESFSNAESSAGAQWRGKFSDGPQTLAGFMMYGTEDGGKLPLLKTVLFNRWNSERVRLKLPEFPDNSMLRTILWGLKRDRPTLERLGVSGIHDGPERGYLSHQGMIDKWQRMLQAAEQRENPSNAR
jgi:hypothetical protein